ncbi:TauD/TfdA family dioxygenase [Bordetella sp. BOR01]|uniref:TauD/TfdA family dioxygenase n=1 Tax=Bordetella sp. BOR01 TaxID=2854779 RepID=UPI001C46FDE6|nr:TauD/TfdA family dioxygenase [Bordetella sp. BOR01]MBV7484153.1 TauD/TfdA family dioxygenase [Bordetella sp. BOR01]
MNKAITIPSPLASPAVRQAALRPRRLSPVDDESAWTADTFRSDDWIRHLSDTHLREIDGAIAKLVRRGRALETVTRHDFEAPAFATFLQEFIHRDIGRRGFGMLRGFPSDKYSCEEIEMFFWGMGTLMGKCVSQNADGDRLGHVRDQGRDYDALNVRGYQTQAHLPFHCDPSDVVGLFCLNKARAGGLSSVVSGISMYNVLLREKPQYLDLLYRGFLYDRRGEETEYQAPISDFVPAYSYLDGDLSIRYVRKSMETAQQKLQVPFTDEEREVLDYMEDLSRREDLVYSMMLEPGDMQFCNNYLVLHSRTQYEDHEKPEDKRHMLRLWVQIPDIRKLAPEFIELHAGSGWSRREGIPARNAPMPILAEAARSLEGATT